jgi:HEPN domain-containing protein
VREAQELVELLLNAVLRSIGVEAPKIHDVGKTLEKHSNILPPGLVENLPEVKRISKQLRKERELSFYGTDDYIPSEEYDWSDAQTAIDAAAFILYVVEQALEPGSRGNTPKDL